MLILQSRCDLEQLRWSTCSATFWPRILAGLNVPQEDEIKPAFSVSLDRAIIESGTADFKTSALRKRSNLAQTCAFLCWDQL